MKKQTRADPDDKKFNTILAIIGIISALFFVIGYFWYQSAYQTTREDLVQCQNENALLRNDKNISIEDNPCWIYNRTSNDWNFGVVKYGTAVCEVLP